MTPTPAALNHRIVRIEARPRDTKARDAALDAEIDGWPPWYAEAMGILLFRRSPSGRDYDHAGIAAFSEIIGSAVNPDDGVARLLAWADNEFPGGQRRFLWSLALAGGQLPPVPFDPAPAIASILADMITNWGTVVGSRSAAATR